jgi:hypothetical protein
MLLRPSNIEPFSFSAIASSPACRRGWGPPVGLLTLCSEIVFAAATTASEIFCDAGLPLSPFSIRFFGRLRGEAGFISSVIAGA